MIKKISKFDIEERDSESVHYRAKPALLSENVSFRGFVIFSSKKLYKLANYQSLIKTLKGR